jgi:hypothetical protein
VSIAALLFSSLARGRGPPRSRSESIREASQPVSGSKETPTPPRQSGTLQLRTTATGTPAQFLFFAIFLTFTPTFLRDSARSYIWHLCYFCYLGTSTGSGSAFPGS